jgi:hypothetical protein
VTDDLRFQTLTALTDISPRVFDIIVTSDMGFECSILTDRGIIFRQPGMLIDFSGGQWPFHDEMSEEETLEKLAELTASLEFWITPFAEIDLETLQLIYSDIQGTEVPE